MIIGFDFDKVLINYPPFLPYKFVDFLYKGSTVFNNKKKEKYVMLSYRFPGTLEQKIRIVSHYPLFRLPIQKNIEALKKISKKKNCKTYLVSSRFGFLKKRTGILIKKYRLDNYFNDVYFNYENKQPHLFKEQTIKNLKIDTYIDDDLDLALYLSKNNPKLKIFWLKNGRKEKVKLPNNVIPISNLQELVENYLT